jgi:hypothetical protein
MESHSASLAERVELSSATSHDGRDLLAE